MPLGGLTDIYGNPSGQAGQQQMMDQGVLEARAAPGTGESHGSYGFQSVGYGGPVPTENQFTVSQNVYDAYSEGDEFWGTDFNPGGSNLDETPTTHDVKWPRGIPQTDGGSLSTPGGLEIAGQQMRLLHGTDQGGVGVFVAGAKSGHEEITHYTTDRYPAPNQSMLTNVPGQIKGANGSASGLLGGGSGGGHGNAGGSAADVDQGYGVNNTMEEFAAGHSIRRVQHDRMPWDFSLIKGEQEVPFYGRHELVRDAQFDGPDSPYFAQGNVDGGLIPWEGRIGDPTEYVQPPTPTVLTAQPGNTDYDVYAWG